MGYRQELKRSLGGFDLVVYGLVFISPTIPFATFGVVFNLSHGMVPLVYAIGIVAMGLTAFSYATMSRAFPVAGSVYAYAARGIGESVGFLAGWAMLLDYVLLPTTAYVLIAVAIQALWPEVPRAACILLCVGFTSAINLLGIENTARLNRLLLAVNLSFLALFMVLAGLALANGVGGAHLSTALASLFVLGKTSFAPGQPTDGAIYEIAGLIGGPWFVLLASSKVMFAGTGAALASQTATARLLFSIARDGKLPRLLAHVNRRSQVPDRAIVLVAAVNIVVGLAFANQLELLASMVSFGALAGFLMLHVSVIVYFIWRLKSRDWARHLVVPILGFAVVAYVMFNMGTMAKLVGLAWLALGASVYFFSAGAGAAGSGRSEL